MNLLFLLYFLNSFYFAYEDNHPFSKRTTFREVSSSQVGKYWGSQFPMGGQPPGRTERAPAAVLHELHAAGDDLLVQLHVGDPVPESKMWSRFLIRMLCGTVDGIRWKTNVSWPRSARACVWCAQVCAGKCHGYPHPIGRCVPVVARGLCACARWE